MGNICSEEKKIRHDIVLEQREIMEKQHRIRKILEADHEKTFLIIQQRSMRCCVMLRRILKRRIKRQRRILKQLLMEIGISCPLCRKKSNKYTKIKNDEECCICTEKECDVKLCNCTHQYCEQCIQDMVEYKSKNNK